MTVPEELSGLRLDQALARMFPEYSRSRLKEWFLTGAITVEGGPKRPRDAVAGGETVTLVPKAEAEVRAAPEPIRLDVVYEDDWFLVINKQRNLIVHPARSHLSGTLLNGLAYRFQQQQAQCGQVPIARSTRGLSEYDRKPEHGSIKGLSRVGANEFRPGIVHRLDKDTTGVMVVAKSDASHWAIVLRSAEEWTQPVSNSLRLEPR